MSLPRQMHVGPSSSRGRPDDRGSARLQIRLVIICLGSRVHFLSAHGSSLAVTATALRAQEYIGWGLTYIICSSPSLHLRYSYRKGASDHRCGCPCSAHAVSTVCQSTIELLAANQRSMRCVSSVLQHDGFPQCFTGAVASSIANSGFQAAPVVPSTQNCANPWQSRIAGGLFSPEPSTASICQVRQNCSTACGQTPVAPGAVAPSVRTYQCP